MVTTLPCTNASPQLALVAVTNAALRTLCRETLREIGFTVADQVESGTAVVTDARKRHLDVIILSEQLSDVPASEAIKWLRSNRMSATSPIIILGGLSNMLLLEDNRLTVLPRPTTRTQLRDTLAQILNATKTNSATPPIDHSR
jgi:DNA-binding response OmpR family regulator